MADGDFLVLGLGSNTSDATTQLSRSGAAQNSALVVTNANGSAVEGSAALSGAGVTGQSDSGDGVHGLATTGQGVYGQSQAYISVRGDSPGWLGVGGYTNTGRGVFGGASGTGDGVVGFANTGTGVTGWSERNTGVQGVTIGGSVGVRGDATNHVGVWGTGGRIGVFGTGSGSGVGVQAVADRNDAMVATSFTARGVVGSTLSSSGTGVHGVANPATAGGTSHIGVRGTSSRGFGLFAETSTGIAGAFIGPVVVIGTFVAVGGPKSAAVPHPDGSHRLTYCLESPDSWFEDFGRARLRRGRTTVQLDPDFAAIVRTDDFHVFLSPEGETEGLYVSDRSATGFEVREQRGGSSDAAFSYRVVARRRDIDASRLAVFDLPDIPAAPAEPEAPLPPTAEPATATQPEWPNLPWQVDSTA